MSLDRASPPRRTLRRGLVLVALSSLAGAQTSKVAVSGDVQGDFALSPDGARVVFRVDAYRDDVFELFAAPAGAQAPALRLNAPLVPRGDVTRFALGAGGRVAYLADQAADQRFELFSAPLDGSAAPLGLSGTLVAGGDVLAMEVTSDGTQVVFLADALVDGQEELFRVPIDGSSAPVALDPAPNGLPKILFWLHPAGTHVFFTEREDVISPFGFPQYRDSLLVLPLQGPPSRVKLASAHFSDNVFAPPFGSEFAELEVTPDGTRVVYTDYVEGKDGPDEIVLNSTAIDGSETPVVLSQGARNFYMRFEQTSAGRIVFAELDNLYSIEVEGANRVNHDPTGWFASDYLFALSPDGLEVCFYSQRIQAGVQTGAVYRAPLDGSSAATALDQRTNLRVEEIVAGETQVVYAARLSSTSTFRALHAVPRDGSAAPVLLNGPAANTTGAYALALTPDERILFRALRVTYVELALVPSDGSLPPERLCSALSSGRFVLDFALAPDGERVAYLADERFDEIHELFTVTLSGGVPPIPYRPEPRPR